MLDRTRPLRGTCEHSLIEKREVGAFLYQVFVRTDTRRHFSLCRNESSLHRCLSAVPPTAAIAQKHLFRHLCHILSHNIIKSSWPASSMTSTSSALFCSSVLEHTEQCHACSSAFLQVRHWAGSRQSLHHIGLLTFRERSHPARCAPLAPCLPG